MDTTAMWNAVTADWRVVTANWQDMRAHWIDSTANWLEPIAKWQEPNGRSYLGERRFGGPDAGSNRGGSSRDRRVRQGDMAEIHCTWPGSGPSACRELVGLSYTCTCMNRSANGWKKLSPILTRRVTR